MIAILHASLKTSFYYGMAYGMGEMRKITVEVPEDDLVAAQDYIGGGVTETVRAALARLRSDRALKKFAIFAAKLSFR